MKTLNTLFTLLIAGLLVACQPTPPAQQQLKELRIGRSISPYSILFEEVIAPILSNQGYSFKYINFSSTRDTNVALAEGAIDVAIENNEEYLKVYNRDTNSDLVGFVHAPSIPPAVFSQRHKSLQDIKLNAVISIPSDPANAARAFIIMQSIGWLKLKDTIDPVKATQYDLAANPYQLKIVEMQAANQPRALKDVDFAIINGTHSSMAGLELKDALFVETLRPNHELIAAVKRQNLNTQWVAAIRAAYQSPHLIKYVQEHSDRWVLPLELQN